MSTLPADILTVDKGIVNDTGWNTTNNASIQSNNDWAAILDMASVIIMTVNLVILMFGMGAATHFYELWQNLKRPWPCLIGMACQFLALPAFGYGLSLLLTLKPYESLGVLFLTCSPGGALSVLFTYWVDGDLALSILMTTVSCLLAFGTMPLNLWIYTRFWTDEQMTVPYINVLISMAFVTGPTLFGMLLRHFTKRWAERISKICSILGWAGALACGSFIVTIYWEGIWQTSWHVLVAASVVPIFGFSVSYFFTKLFCIKHAVSRTVGLETASQNIVVATNVALMSFAEKEVRSQLIIFPALYGLFQLGEVFVFIILYQLYKFRHRHDVTEEIVKNVVDNNVLTRVPLPVLQSDINNFRNKTNKSTTRPPDVLYGRIPTAPVEDDILETIYNQHFYQSGLEKKHSQIVNQKTINTNQNNNSHPSKRSNDKNLQQYTDVNWSHNASANPQEDLSPLYDTPVGSFNFAQKTIAHNFINPRNSPASTTSRGNTSLPDQRQENDPYRLWCHRDSTDTGYSHDDSEEDSISETATTHSSHTGSERPCNPSNTAEERIKTMRSATNRANYGWNISTTGQPIFYTYDNKPTPETPRSPSLNTGYDFSTFKDKSDAYFD